jgi:hypothetical protein
MIGDDPPAAGAKRRPAPANESPTEGNLGDRPAQLPTARAARLPAARAAHRRPRPIRRVPKPRMTGLFDSPGRNLIVGVGYIITVMILATTAYMAVGWSFRDALYMVITTVYTVGYEEVRPINTPALYVITIALIVLGCAGIIFLTGVLVSSSR